MTQNLLPTYSDALKTWMLGRAVRLELQVSCSCYHQRQYDTFQLSPTINVTPFDRIEPDFVALNVYVPGKSKFRVAMPLASVVKPNTVVPETGAPLDPSLT